MADRISSLRGEYRQGFIDGYETAKGAFSFSKDFEKISIGPDFLREIPQRKPRRTIKQTPKQKLLTKMTAVKWNKYKKGKGKKTYVEIRAEVSRSQLYKRKAKRLPSKYPRA